MARYLGGSTQVGAAASPLPSRRPRPCGLARGAARAPACAESLVVIVYSGERKRHDIRLCACMLNSTLTFI